MIQYARVWEWTAAYHDRVIASSSHPLNCSCGTAMVTCCDLPASGNWKQINEIDDLRTAGFRRDLGAFVGGMAIHGARGD